MARRTRKVKRSRSRKVRGVSRKRRTKKGGMRPALKNHKIRKSSPISSISKAKAALSKKRRQASKQRKSVSAHQRRVRRAVSSAKKKRKKTTPRKSATIIVGSDGMFQRRKISSVRDGLKLGTGIDPNYKVLVKNKYEPYRVTSSARSAAKKEKKRILKEHFYYPSSSSSPVSIKESMVSNRPNPPGLFQGAKDAAQFEALPFREQVIQGEGMTAAEFNRKLPPAPNYSNNSYDTKLKFAHYIGRHSSSVKRSVDKKDKAAASIQRAVKKRQTGKMVDKRKDKRRLREQNKHARVIQRHYRGRKVRKIPPPPSPSKGSSSDSSRTALKKAIRKGRKKRVYSKKIKQYKDRIAHQQIIPQVY